DTQGNTYVTGSTESGDFPLSAPLQPNFQAAAGPTSDVFVSKISPDGGRLIWSTFLGGNGRDTGFAIVVAGDGTVYVSGVTESPNFPNARAAQATYGGGTSDGFVARIAASGASVDWSTFVGGGGTDRIRGMAVDATGNAYVTGSTNSDNFPSVNPQQPGPYRPDDVDAFLVKVAPGGAPFVFATRLGGGNEDRGLAVAVDDQGSAYVTGDTLSSPGFPTVRPIQAASRGGAGAGPGPFPDAFVTKYNPAGSALVYSTLLGGGDVDQGTAIDVDAQGAVYVAGNTNSTNFPTVGPLQATKGGEPDAFVTKIDAAGSTIVYSTYVGGNGPDGANAIAVDRTGSAHVVGTTGSANFVSAKAVQAQKGGGDDAFLLKLDSTGRGPLFSSFLGGREADAGMGLAIDAQGRVRVVGQTASADFPSVKPVQGSRPPAGGDAFLASIDLTDPVTPTTAAPRETATAPAASSADAHDQRVRILGFLTFALLLAAVAQTLYLRRRAPAVTQLPAQRPAPKPTATAGLAVLDKGGKGGKAGGPKSTRSPKARGGPKGAAAQKKAAAARKAANRKAPRTGSTAAPTDAPTEVETPVSSGVVAGPDEPDDGGPATMATAAVEAADAAIEPEAEAAPALEPEPKPEAVPERARPKPQAPAIASLLEEDLWAPDRFEEPEGRPDAEGEAPADAAPAPPEPAPEWAPFDTGSTPAVDADGPPPQPV
ncbi:MAG TPA: SBBP repeat-containing protein, partial [Acidimicrobiales bacterium]|nr:SBBP repeat-containing protein [Acidimicrobiales bacterium]